MGIFDGFFEKYQRQQELIARAQHVGELEDVLEMGILAAQLGLTPEDIPKMARLYLLVNGRQGD